MFDKGGNETTVENRDEYNPCSLITGIKSFSKRFTIKVCITKHCFS